MTDRFHLAFRVAYRLRERMAAYKAYHGYTSLVLLRQLNFVRRVMAREQTNR